MRHIFFIVFCLFFNVKHAQALSAVHALSMHGKPKYKSNFSHFDYVNPNAKKGGKIKMSAIGTFDNFNPFIIKGISPAGIGYLYESLLTSSADEPFSEYGLIAKSIELPKDRSFITFNLRKNAYFSDKKPITADDVVFSFNILKEKGLPFYRYYYSNIKKVKKLGKLKVKFEFKDNKNRELPLIIGQMPIIPKHYWENRNFNKTSLEKPIGSGPYKISRFEQGRFIEYKKDNNWWGKNLNVNIGKYNFDKIYYDYYRDTTVALEAFKSNEYDLRIETESKKWANGYKFKAVDNGKVILKNFYHKNTSAIQGFIFNIRRFPFSDRNVRLALSYAFDFEWSNKNLFYGQYNRTESYFDNSNMEQSKKISKDVIKLLNPYKDIIPKEAFYKKYYAPKTDKNNNIRSNLLHAMKILEDNGWEVKDGILVNKETKKPFEFEIMLNASTAAAWERIALPFAKNLKKLGIKAKVRTVDSNQYQNRKQNFDFDMITHIWGQSLSPGNEQMSYWGSDSADQTGSKNLIGIKNKAIDAIINKIISAKTRKELENATKALDRILTFEYYLIPHWHISYDRLAYWNKFDMPKKTPLQGVQINTWWIK